MEGEAEGLELACRRQKLSRATAVIAARWLLVGVMGSEGNGLKDCLAMGKEKEKLVLMAEASGASINSYLE